MEKRRGEYERVEKRYESLKGVRWVGSVLGGFWGVWGVFRDVFGKFLRSLREGE